jgi:hypothetical protein
MHLKPLLILPFLAGLFACMQVQEPGMGGEGECVEGEGLRIGGTSVGCGNPSRGFALNPIPICDEFSGACLGGPENFPISVTIGNQLKIRIHFEGDTTLIQPPKDTSIHFGTPKAILRYDGQIYPMDSIPLGVFTFPSQDSLVLNFQSICDSIDKPDRVCSDVKWQSIPVSIQIVVPAVSGPDSFEYRANIQGIVVQSRQKKLEWAAGGRSGQDLWLQAAFGWAEAQMDASFFGERDSLFGWLLYIPGTEGFYVACQADAIIQFQNLVSGTLDVRALPIPLAQEDGWQPVFQVDSVNSDPLMGPNQRSISLGHVVDSVRIPKMFYETRTQNYCLAD